ncbi:sel1 repeat family protein [Allofrancisella guangzhouensis]|uniref:Sel1 repeat family protein n=1 Tax=Allofrancisella guangzhouensis TaxID=594679 RepID=A0A0A8E8Z6_9GAMM|nr:tetratricopeptide repeat protein [Allofrancisella guangzhouensis]AJC48596.1 hypothetical protein SD28_02475 [Allofrancisella guangzhouensis]MBK2027737.1 sel1 repeat family protein [Allofrancisella guangzhouensis]MBK2043475.1 sel1 repeat family protein [Allofrancisella guangzhouensis]MBK2045822.1 sel1 repeat family protein [Allofrancisella guangzhouensis]
MKVKFLIYFLGLLLFGSSYATLENCYQDGVGEKYAQALENCQPYAEKDAKATAILAQAYIQTDQNNKLALEYALWVVDFYNKNGIPSSGDGLKNYYSLMYLIGEMYYFGADGVKINRAKGFEYIKKSAELGYMVAQNQLGNLYARSGGNPWPNFAQAFKWYKLAVANGSLMARDSFLIKKEDSFVKLYPYCIAQARTFIGDAYMSGTGGLPKDNTIALEWYKKAYELNHISPVEVGLANVYLAKGDKQTASVYAKQAITQPFAPAFVLAAELTQDPVEKYTYLSVAIDLFKKPRLGYWKQFNEYCMPNLSKDGLKDAQTKLTTIKLPENQAQAADQKIKAIESQWTTSIASSASSN